MKKRTRGYSRLRWRIGVYMFLGLPLVIVAMLKLRSWDVCDEVKQHQISDPFKPKLAFLFLARHFMPLDILWEHFFEESRENEFSIYIHARPGYSYTEENTMCRFFVDRQLKNPTQVVWGEATMIQAERLLLTEALKEPLNDRFLLISDSCIPMYNFEFVYNYVMASEKSFVDRFNFKLVSYSKWVLGGSFIDYSDKQYNDDMKAVIPHENWRKGSQWFTLTRKHAEAVAADSTVFPMFVQYCKKKNGTKMPHNCIPDEHYIQTLFAMKDLERETERRTLTYSRWENHVKNKGREGWHPVTFTFQDSTLETIKYIQAFRNIRYETESRTEWCKVAGKERPCFLFARKFTRAAGFRLLDQVTKYEKAVPS
nr:uncharacterized protein LOC112292983 isoform X2 [Physcomitrium patens]|eukprot:XP_024397750.1 uncharacterized protein LOC112292983 isoform X2 [Physcomitrella patens]